MTKERYVELVSNASAHAASTKVGYQISEKKLRELENLNFLDFFNNSSSDVIVRLDAHPDKAIFVKANSGFIWDKLDNILYRSIQVEELSAVEIAINGLRMLMGWNP